jgi:hypothetical protein
LKESISGPSYGYARYSSKSVLAFMRLTNSLLRDISDGRSPVSQIEKTFVSLLVEKDHAVNNAFIQEKMQQWTQKYGAKYNSYQFPASTGLTHDFIDPNQTTAHIDISYPKIIELLK